MRGKLIVIEGMDGCGKDSQLEAIKLLLEEQGRKVNVTREPGETDLGEKLRELCLHHCTDNLGQILLQMAARREHCQKVIEPMLQRGEWVISNRYYPSTYAYQAFGADRFEYVTLIGDLLRSCEITNPDLVLIFDVPAETALQRRSSRSTTDQFESQDSVYFERVREGYLWLHEKMKLSMPSVVIDATHSKQQVQAAVADVLSNWNFEFS